MALPACYTFCMDLTAFLDTAREVARRARQDVDLYAEFGTRGGMVPGTKFYRKGGLDAFHLDTLRRRADDAERAVADLEKMIMDLGE